MTLFDIGRIMGSGVGPELIQTLKRIADKQGLGVDEVMRESLVFIKRMESLGARSGYSVKQVADQALDLFEGNLR